MKEVTEKVKEIYYRGESNLLNLYCMNSLHRRAGHKHSLIWASYSSLKKFIVVNTLANVSTLFISVTPQT